jgi:transcriptional regulator with GAF, ATPase, and Fis domain
MDNKTRTLSSDVVKRMMSASEFEEFWKKYRESRLSKGMRNRFQTERPELTEKDKRFINDYLNNTEKTQADLAREYDIPLKSVGSYIHKLALRILWLNKEKLGF